MCALRFTNVSGDVQVHDEFMTWSRDFSVYNGSDVVANILAQGGRFVPAAELGVQGSINRKPIRQILKKTQLYFLVSDKIDENSEIDLNFTPQELKDFDEYMTKIQETVDHIIGQLLEKYNIGTSVDDIKSNPKVCNVLFYIYEEVMNIIQDDSLFNKNFQINKLIQQGIVYLNEVLKKYSKEIKGKVS